MFETKQCFFRNCVFLRRLICFNSSNTFHICCVILGFIYILNQEVIAQTSPSLSPHIPTSPQADAFARYGDIAINTSTGSPDISISLLEINHRGYKIPVALRYNAQPLKAGYNYDVVGHGWGLSMNSCISRSIEYQPDELKDFQLEIPSSTEYVSLCGNSCLKEKNFAHDKFQAVLPDGSSFSFFIEKVNGVKKIFLSNDRNVKIDYGISNTQITWFTILDESGVKYTFDCADEAYPGTNSYYSYYVSWQLSRIDLPNSPEPILFNYSYLMRSRSYTACMEPVIELKHSFTSGKLPIEDNPHIYTARKYSEAYPTAYNMRLLQSISYGPEGKDRLLLAYRNSSGSEYNSVTEIRLQEEGKLIRKISFHMDVLNPSGNCYPMQLNRLDSISISGAVGLPYKYKFGYSSRPSVFGGTDHWGNMNYADYNAMPYFSLFSEWHPQSPSEPVLYANMTELTKKSTDLSPFRKFSLSSQILQDTRSALSPEAHGVLERITYPTGGYSIFRFENHRYYSQTDFNGDFIHDISRRVIREGGGFRIKTIENYSSEGQLAGKKSFAYGKTQKEIGILVDPDLHTGAGEPVADPNIRTYMNYSSYQVFFPIVNMILGLNSAGQNQAFINPFTGNDYGMRSWAWQCNFSALNFRRLLNGRPAVLYDKVTVYSEDIANLASNAFPVGKTEYVYDLKDGVYSEGPFFEPPQYFGNMLGYVARDYRYNKLLEKIDYRYDKASSTFVKVRKERNTWLQSTAALYDYQFTNEHMAEYRPAYISPSSLFVGRPFYIGNARLTSTRIVDYYGTDSLITVMANYDYNTNGQLKNKTEYSSTGNEIITKFSYPTDTSSAGQNNPSVLQAMLNRNLITPILNTLTYMPGLIPRQYEQRSGRNVEYRDFGGKLLPAKIYDLEFGPVDESYRLREEIKSYSANGNPIEVVGRGRSTKSFIWGYDDRYMIAQVQNASAADVAYTGFESDEKGNWSYTSVPSVLSAYTGQRCYNLSSSNPISKSGLSSDKTYMLSLVVKGTTGLSLSGGTVVSNTSMALGEGWTLHRYIIKNATAISLSSTTASGTLIDDARLHPIGAQMSTYTYRPLIGVTSMTDARGITEFYEYDGQGRLSMVKDYQGNITKSYCYNYSGQRVDCGTGGVITNP